MGPLGHFAVGLLCGILIMLPFLRDRSLYDYDKQRWVSIEWMPYIKPDLTIGDKKLFTTDKYTEQFITNELNPITKSKFVMWMPIIAITCGFLAMMPDISHLWGDPGLDKSRFADLFFFHHSIDMYFAANHVNTMESLQIEIPLMMITLSFMISMIAIAQENQYNRHNYENCLV
jgi:hypothetical protein